MCMLACWFRHVVAQDAFGQACQIAAALVPSEFGVTVLDTLSASPRPLPGMVVAALDLLLAVCLGSPFEHFVITNTRISHRTQ